MLPRWLIPKIFHELLGNFFEGRGGNPGLSRPGEEKRGVINTAQVMF
jgi:hypothetical protein